MKHDRVVTYEVVVIGRSRAVRREVEGMNQVKAVRQDVVVTKQSIVVMEEEIPIVARLMGMREMGICRTGMEEEDMDGMEDDLDSDDEDNE
jgi:hypothetical protein